MIGEVTRHHGDAVHDGTNRKTQGTASTVIGDEGQMSYGIEFDGLISSIITGHIAFTTVDTKLVIYKRNHLLLVVKLHVSADLVNGTTDLITDRRRMNTINDRRKSVIDKDVSILEVVATDFSALLLIGSKLGKTVGWAKFLMKLVLAFDK